MSYVNDAIAAISTPPGQGAVAVLRLSGKDALTIAAKVFRGRQRPAEATPRVQNFGTIVDNSGTVVDQVLLTVFRSPASYTGEDLVEIGCHGGALVTRRILELLLSAGARAAEPGEFTQRAFLNGKMDLTQAEAVMDLISAQTSLALRSANEQLEGRLGGAITAAREDLLNVLAHVEAYIDFPEEDISPETGSALKARMEKVANLLDGLLATANRGRILREGVRTVICGAPNVGKSSLLNVLLGFERAIVSDVAGTTRDTIEEAIQVRGLPLRLVDTAGVHAATDAIEKEGIERTQRQLAGADLILEIVDAHLPDQTRITLPVDSQAKHILVLNKTDLGLHPNWEGTQGVALSCTAGSGLELLCDAIFDLLADGMGENSASMVAINARHYDCMSRARDYLTAAMAGLDNNDSPEYTALEIRSALDAIGEVVGKVDAEELLGVIFGSFCIGK
ncbi:MAG: tRNA uridine-5-carboxymethylaminomethyl(34) synthesis GTPase MnmE [Verrucomicrobiae bacterium]|nr:tRNA uridine-5-carboxymethylaminomethyl(34) synthesis GTPase MnmE [Verrucomicrobiae bacterium]